MDFFDLVADDTPSAGKGDVDEPPRGSIVSGSLLSSVTSGNSLSQSWWLDEALVRHNEALLRVWMGGLVAQGKALSPFAALGNPMAPFYTKRENQTIALSETVYDAYDVYECHRTFGEFYDVECVMGKGAFGTVVSARHRDSGKVCTVKVINKVAAGERYRVGVVEGGIWSCLLWTTTAHPHPNIVHYFDFLDGHTDFFVVMEVLEGLELLEKFEKDLSPVTESTCKHVMRQVLAALSHIHDKVGIYHRDVKLENFMYRTKTGLRACLGGFWPCTFYLR